MPDLGDYAGTVLSAYAVSLALLLIIVVMSRRRARKVKADLDAIEERLGRG